MNSESGQPEQEIWYAVHMREPPYVKIIEEMVNPSLEELQEAVKGSSPRGMIERVPNKVGFEVYCHEEGLMWQLPQNNLFGSMVGWRNMDTIFHMTMFPNLGTIVIKDNDALRKWDSGILYNDLVRIAKWGKTQCKVCGSGRDAEEIENEHLHNNCKVCDSKIRGEEE
tara:strand:- start:626 stop:1129 length:504 start_codon:yes stop_codon:yes gene_type:complete